MLTQEQIALYRANGYIGVEGMLSEEEVLELRRVTDAFVEKSRQVTQSDEVFDLEPGHTPEAPRLRRLKNPAFQHPVYDRTMRHDGILDVVAQLIGPAIRCPRNSHKLNIRTGRSTTAPKYTTPFPRPVIGDSRMSRRS